MLSLPLDFALGAARLMRVPAQDRPEAHMGLPALADSVWDLAVVGAGVAGAVVAGLGAKAGWKTLLVEKEPWPRQKVCGCCLNERGIGVLKRCGILPYLPANDCVPLKQMELIGRRSRAAIALPGGSVISRSGLDGAVAAWAQDQGAFFLPETLARPQADAGGRFVGTLLESRATSASIKSRFLVGAWGIAGNAAKWNAALTTRVQPSSHMGAGTILPRESNSALPMGTLLMAVGKEGYAGVVRLGDGSLDVAAALDAKLVRKAGGPGQLVRELLQKTDPSLAEACAQAPWKGTPPLTRRAGKISSGRILLVGDAIGYVEPFTGEGMTWGLVGGEALAQVLTNRVNPQAGLTRSDKRGETSMDADDDRAIDRIHLAWKAAYRSRIEQRQGTCRALSAALRLPVLTELGISSLRFFPGAGTRLARWLARGGSETATKEQY